MRQRLAGCVLILVAGVAGCAGPPVTPLAGAPFGDSSTSADQTGDPAATRRRPRRPPRPRRPRSRGHRRAGAGPRPTPSACASSTSTAVVAVHFGLSSGTRPAAAPVARPGPTRPRRRAGSAVLRSHGLTSSPEAYQGLTTKFAAAGFVVAGPASRSRAPVSRPTTPATWATSRPTPRTSSPKCSSSTAAPVTCWPGTSTAPTSPPVATRPAVTRPSACCRAVAATPGSRAASCSPAAAWAVRSAVPSTPVLFVHGDNDRVVMYATGHAVDARLTWPKAFLTIVGGDHVAPVVGAGEAASASARTMLDFLRYTLTATPGRSPGCAATRRSPAGRPTRRRCSTRPRPRRYDDRQRCGSGAEDGTMGDIDGVVVGLDNGGTSNNATVLDADGHVPGRPPGRGAQPGPRGAGRSPSRRWSQALDTRPGGDRRRR